MLGQGCLGQLCLGETQHPFQHVLLDASRGLFALSGVAAAVTSFRSISCAVRAFALTGFAADVRTGLGMLGAHGTYTITGTLGVLARAIAVPEKFVIRVADYALRKSRRAKPTLEE